jgi:hypothetical protein
MKKIFVIFRKLRKTRTPIGPKIVRPKSPTDPAELGIGAAARPPTVLLDLLLKLSVSGESTPATNVGPIISDELIDNLRKIGGI